MKNLNLRSLPRTCLLITCLVIFCSFIEYQDIIPQTFTENTDLEFISKTKPNIDEYSKSIWGYMKLMNELDKKDSEVLKTDVTSIQGSLNKIIKSLETSPIPVNPDLISFKNEFSLTLKICLESLNQFPADKPGKAKGKAKKLEKENINKIINSAKKFRTSNDGIIILFQKYYGVLVPEIALTDDDYKYLQAEKLLAEGKNNDAIAALDKILLKNNNHLKSHKLKGKIYVLNNAPKEAEKSFLEALRLDLKDPEVFFEIGKILEMQNKYNDAINSYEVALKIKPDYPQALYKCGLIMVNNDIRPDVGKERLKQFMEIAPQHKSKSITDDMIKNTENILTPKKQSEAKKEKKENKSENKENKPEKKENKPEKKDVKPNKDNKQKNK